MNYVRACILPAVTERMIVGCTSQSSNSGSTLRCFALSHVLSTSVISAAGSTARTPNLCVLMCLCARVVQLLLFRAQCSVFHCSHSVGGTAQYETCVLVCVSAGSHSSQHVDFSEQVKDPSNADVKPDIPFQTALLFYIYFNFKFVYSVNVQMKLNCFYPSFLCVSVCVVFEQRTSRVAIEIYEQRNAFVQDVVTRKS